MRHKLTKEIVNAFSVQPHKEADEFFKMKQIIWESSEPCKQLRLILTSSKIPYITKIIGFACGSIAWSDDEQNTTRAAFQHALILTLLDIIGRANPQQITCYTQDPSYLETDKFVLEKNGIAVLNDPKAFLEVDDSTIVVSCAPSVPIKQIVSDLARPAMLI